MFQQQLDINIDDITVIKHELSHPVKQKQNGIAAIDDHLNRQIVKMLQTDGRRPYKEIATTLGVSEGTVRNRVQLMKKAGALRIVALVDPTEVRYQADAIIGIKVAANHSVDKIAKRLGQSPDVVYILWVTGRYDLLVEIVTDSLHRFHEFLETEIHLQPDIASSEVMSGLKNFKNQFLLKYD